MNILYVMRIWPYYGGGETVTATLANEFVERGHSVHAVYSYFNEKKNMSYSLDKRIVSCKLAGIDHYSKLGVSNLRKYIVDNGINIMIVQWADVRLCSEARVGTRCNLITCWHVSILTKYNVDILSPKLKLLRLIMGDKITEKVFLRNQIQSHIYNYRKSNRYVFLSEASKGEFVKLTKLNDNKRLAVIPNPLTYKVKYDFSRYEKKEKIVLFVGRMEEYPKRMSLVLRIWKEIEKDHRFDGWRLILIGEGDDLERTKRFSNQLFLKRAEFAGFQNPTAFYEKSSVFLMTSSFEGFGMTLLEAQQHACVPIAFDSYSTLHEIITDNKDGVIIPDNNIERYVESLKMLMLNDEWRKLLAKTALLNCQRFSVESISDKWETIFNKLV